MIDESNYIFRIWGREDGQVFHFVSPSQHPKKTLKRLQFFVKPQDDKYGYSRAAEVLDILFLGIPGGYDFRQMRIQILV